MPDVCCDISLSHEPIAYSTFLGYDKGEDGNLVVKEKEARIVRLIYRKFMEGMAPIGICRMLDEMGILTPGGKTHWRESTILSILSNEKYKGDALLQKTFTVDFLTKKHKQNEGEVPQYYVRGNHEAIIPPDEFEQVQAELARRKRSGWTFSGNSVFASRLICGDCGGYYGQKVWHSNDPYRKVIWRCNRKYGKGQRCSTPTLSEDAIKALFVKAYNLLLGNKETVIEDCETLTAMLEDTAALDTKIAATQEEIDTVVELNKALIREHAVTGVPQEEFDQKAAAYDERFRKADAKLNRLKSEKQDRLMRVCSVKNYVENLRGQAGPIEVRNEQAWCLLVTQVTVHADGSAEFLFRGENRMTADKKTSLFAFSHDYQARGGVYFDDKNTKGYHSGNEI